MLIFPVPTTTASSNVITRFELRLIPVAPSAGRRVVMAGSIMSTPAAV